MEDHGYVIADGALAITIACSDELPSAKRGICWFHVCQNFDKELPKSKIYENACNEVKEDAKILARATCYEEFHAASLTLIAHWNQKWNEHRRIMGDLHKFHQSWLLKEDHHGWFYRFASSIGVGMSSLPTNNGLEGTKNMPKPDHGCPNGEKNVLEFMDVLNKLKEESNNKGPILLHCSAGCGRTGSVIAIDIFRELLTSKFRCGRKKLKQNKAGRLESHQVLEKDNSDQIELSLRSCSISSSLTACGKEFQQSSSDGLEITNNQRLSAGCYDDYDYYQRSSAYANANPYYGAGYSPYTQQQTQTIVVQRPARRASNPSKPLPVPAEVPDLPPAQIYDLASVQPIGFEAVQKNSSETVEPPQSRMISAEVAPANVQPLGLEAIGQSSAKGFYPSKEVSAKDPAKNISGTNVSAEGASAKAVVKKNKISGSLKSAKEPSKDDIDNNRPLARTYASSPVQISFKDVGSVKSVSKRQNSAPSSRNWDKVNAIKSSRKVRAKACNAEIPGARVQSDETARNAQARGNEVRPKKRARKCCKLTEINLKQLVLELRKQRVCMVQTPGQYQFLHKCIAHYCKQYMGLVMKNVPESNSTTAKEESSNGLFSGKDMPDEKAANLDSGATTAATSENEHNRMAMGQSAHFIPLNINSSHQNLFTLDADD